MELIKSKRLKMFSYNSAKVNCPSCKHEFSLKMANDFASSAFPPGSCIVCPSCGHTFSMGNVEISASYLEEHLYMAAITVAMLVVFISALLIYAL